jgi:hypothetical protein
MGLSKLISTFYPVTLKIFARSSLLAAVIETGFIAQEAFEIIPQIVSVGGDDVKENPWGIDYGKLTPYLAKAIQEQQAMIEELKQDNTQLRYALQNKVEANDLEKLKAEVQYLKDALLKAEK